MTQKFAAFNDLEMLFYAEICFLRRFEWILLPIVWRQLRNNE